MPNKSNTRFSARKRLIVVAISACFSSAPAWANPTGPQVVNGNASFNQAGNLLTVTNTNGAIINWNTFSIGASETTRFNQTSAASSVLNRVIANDPSVLLGTLSSNGKVWLVNPAGILVGQGARIDVAGFIASTLNVRSEDFLAGRLNFGATPNAGSIRNYGQITTPSGGSVYLVAPNVENHGVINAPNGEVILAAGQTVQLIDTGTPGVTVDITGAEGNVTNLGEIAAEAGRIGMAGVLVKNSGTLSASSVVREGGRIFLKASQDAYVDGAGRIVATGTKGGSIEVLGNRVAAAGQAQLDASGDAAGGTILIGGDASGANPAVQNAQRTFIGPDAAIRADAKTTGDGGKVVVWADGDTRFYGSISARGGSQSGNGGFVETSGALLNASGSVSTSAPHGKEGTWLLDPYDIEIVSGLAGVAYGGDSCLPNCFDLATSGTSQIGVTTIEQATGNVIVEAEHDLTLLTDLALTSRKDFTGRAGNNINLGSFNVNIHGNLTLSANDIGAATQFGGSITSNPAFGNVNTDGGNIDLSGTAVTVGTLNTSGPADGSHGNGDVAITASAGGISTGAITTRASNAYWYGGEVFLQTDAGGITVNGNIDSSGANGTETPVDTSYGGSSGGYVDINAINSGNIAVNGTIDTHGGSGIPGAPLSLSGSGFAGSAVSNGGDGGSAGGVWLNASSGSVTTNAIYAYGGGGGDGGAVNVSGATLSNTSVGLFAYGGAAGSGNAVEVYATGAVTVNGPIDTSGGAGGDGGSLNFTEASPGNYSALNAYAYGNDGGHAGWVSIYASSIATREISGRGGAGGNGGTADISATLSTSASLYMDGSAGHGGGGNSVDLDTTGLGGSGIVTVAGPIDVSGGAGGNGAASLVFAGSIGNFSSVSMSAIGGYGGDSYSAGVGIYGTSVSTQGIASKGGKGGNGGTIALSGAIGIGADVYLEAEGRGGGDGGEGAGGNAVQLSATGDVVANGAIDASGGDGGTGGKVSFAGTGSMDVTSVLNAYMSGGYGASGGLVMIEGASIATQAINAYGGAGGDGGTQSISGAGSASLNSWSYGTSGGWGAPISLAAAGNIAVNGSINVSGGAGSNGGSGAYVDGGEGGSAGYAYVYVDTPYVPPVYVYGDAFDQYGGLVACSPNCLLSYTYNYNYAYTYGAGVTLTAGGQLATGAIYAYGGRGGNAGASTGFGGYAGSGAAVAASAANIAVNGVIDVSGGLGGNGSGSGGAGGIGGSAGRTATYEYSNSSTYDYIYPNGSQFTASYLSTSDNHTIDGSGVSLSASGQLSTGGIFAYGGNAGTGAGEYTYYGGSTGAHGSVITLGAGTGGIAVSGPIVTSGGNSGHLSEYRGIGIDGGSASANYSHDTSSEYLQLYDFLTSSSTTSTNTSSSTTLIEQGIGIAASGPVSISGGITANGGAAAAGAAGLLSAGGDGGVGGAGGIFTLNSGAGTVSVAGGFSANGGAGGAGGAGDVGYGGGVAGAGGAAGSVSIAAAGDISATGSVSTLGGLSGDSSTSAANGLASLSSSGGSVTVQSDVYRYNTAHAATFFNWYAQTPGLAMNVTQALFAGIDAPVIRVGNSAVSGNISIDESIAVPATTPTLGLITTGSISQASGTAVTVPNLSADGSSVSLTGANSVVNLQGRAANGDFVFMNSASLNITAGLLDPAVTAGITATGNVSLASGGTLTQSAPLDLSGALTTSSTGGQTLSGVNNISGRIDMTAGGPLILWGSGDLNLGAIDAGTNAAEIKAGGAILQAPGTESGINLVAGSANLESIFGGASGGLAISANTQVTGALVASVGAEADFGGIRIQNTGAQPASVVLTDNALAGASVSFLNTGDITSTSGFTLETLNGGDLALLSNGNIIWNGGSLVTPTGSVQISADGSVGVTGALSSPVDLALSSTTSISVSGSVITQGTGTAAFVAPSVTISGSVDSADDVGVIADTISLASGSSTSATHDVILAAANITATSATVSADHDISAAVTGDLRLNSSGFTAGNDIFINMLGATSTLYLNEVSGLQEASFLWAQAPSTIFLTYSARESGGLVVDGVATDAFTYVSTAGGSGLFYGPEKHPAVPGDGLQLTFAGGLPPVDGTPVDPTVLSAVIAAVNATATSTVERAGTLPGTFDTDFGTLGSLGGSDDSIGGTEGSFGGDEEDENKTDEGTGLKKKADKPTKKKLSTCS